MQNMRIQKHKYIEQFFTINTYRNYLSANEKRNFNYVDLFAPKPCTKTKAGPQLPEH